MEEVNGRELKLDAVNSMLMAAELPMIASLDTEVLAEDVKRAIKILDQVSRRVQQQEKVHGSYRAAVVVQPNREGHIVIPDSWLTVTAPEGHQNNYSVRQFRTDEVVERRLYDMLRDSTDFMAPVTLDVMLNVPYEDLAVHVQEYVRYAAIWEWLVNETGDDDKVEAYREFAYTALSNLRTKEASLYTSNLNENPFIFRYGMSRRRGIL